MSHLKRRHFLSLGAGVAASGLLAAPAVHLSAQTTDKRELRIGHVNDITAAPLFAARSQDAFASNDLDVELRPSRTLEDLETALRDGTVDAAIMPYGRPLLSVFKPNTLAREQLVIPAVTMMGGAAFCATEEFYDRLVDVDRDAMIAARPTSARAIATLIAEGGARSGQRLRFGVTQRNSMEEFLLRYWLSAGGVDPDVNIEFVEQPGPFLVASLRARALDGFFAVEPWSAHAIAAGHGRSMITAQEIWGNAPLSALVTNLGFVEANPNSLSQLIRALIEGGAWADPLDNRGRLTRLLARESTLNLPESVSGNVLAEGYRYINELGIEPFPDYAIFHRYVCHYPWLSDALWFLTQMVRWGALREPVDLRRITQGVLRPDLYRNAVLDGEEPLPRQEYRVEGTYFSPHIVEDATQQFIMGGDAFVDGASFNPGRLTEYISSFEMGTPQLDMIAFSELNG